MIPPGTHYISYGAADTFGGTATTISFYVHIEPKQVIVKKWDKETEDLVDLSDEDERERYVAGVRHFDFDAGLAAYPQEKIQEWIQMSNYITAAVLKRLEPPAKRISAAASPSVSEEELRIAEQFNNFHLKNTEAKKKSQDSTEMKDTPPLEPQDATSSTPPTSTTPQAPSKPNSKLVNPEYCPKFTIIPKRVAEKGATPQEVTSQNLDKSQLLYKLLEASYSGDENALLGELQFAFTSFFFGHSYEGFRQWKDLLILLTSCEASLRTKMQLFYNFIDLFMIQVDQIPADFFHDAISGNNFLKQIFKGFFENTGETGINLQLVSKARILKFAMEKRFQVSFSIEEFEEDEDAPVLVVLDE